MLKRLFQLRFHPINFLRRVLCRSSISPMNPRTQHKRTVDDIKQRPTVRHTLLHFSMMLLARIFKRTVFLALVPRRRALHCV